MIDLTYDFSGLDANQAIATFFGQHGATLPEDQFEAIADVLAASDGLNTIITALEALYSVRADLNDAGVNLLHGLAKMAGAKGFYGYGASGRGVAIKTVAERIAEEGDAEAEGDPELVAPWAPTTPPESPPPGP